MKRSEMITIMYHTVNKHPDVFYDSHISTAAISATLDAMEKAGMLAPDNGKEASYVIDYRYKCLKWDEE